MHTGTPSSDKTLERTRPSYGIVRLDEFCRTLGIGRSTYYKLLALGKLNPALKISKRARGYTQDYLQSVIADLAK